MSAWDGIHLIAAALCLLTAAYLWGCRPLYVVLGKRTLFGGLLAGLFAAAAFNLLAVLHR